MMINQSNFQHQDLLELSAIALNGWPSKDSKDGMRLAHLCHLAAMLLQPTHPRASTSLRSVCDLVHVGAPVAIPASELMKAYGISDLGTLRRDLILQIGEEDRAPCAGQLPKREPGMILLDMDLPAGKALLAYLGALEQRLGLSEYQRQKGLSAVPLLLTGGLLAHLYTGVHPSYAIEAEFGAPIPCPPELVIELLDSGGKPQVAYLDLGVHTELGLWHPEAQERCLPIFADIKGFDLTVPRPIDLAVSMCTHLTQSEGLWIDAMARAGLFTAAEFRDHAAQALLECELEDAQIKCIEHHVELAATLVERAQLPKASPKGSRRPT